MMNLVFLINDDKLTKTDNFEFAFCGIKVVDTNSRCPTVLELFNFVEWPNSTRNQQEIGLDPRFADIYTFSICVRDVAWLTEVHAKFVRRKLDFSLIFNKMDYVKLNNGVHTRA